MGRLSGLTIGCYLMALVFGGAGSLLAALMVRAVVRRIMAKKVWPRMAFWATLAGLTGWLLWALFVPSVNFEIESLSPDGRIMLRLQDITDSWLYDDLGWRMRVRMEDTRTGRRLAATTISDWNSGFDDMGLVMPTPDDVEVIWSPDGRSVRVRLGDSCWVLPEGVRTDP